MGSQGFLGLDIGGTGAKASVFDESGRMLGFGRASCTPSTSSEGHTEIAIEEICTAARHAIRQAVVESGTRVCAMAISSQGQTFVSLDECDRPLHAAILWYDSRGAAHARKLGQMASGCDATSPSEISTASKILWLRENYPERMAKARKFLLLPDYLSYSLTGEAVTDPSTAESTGLYQDDAADYSEQMLRLSGIQKGQLARIALSGTPIGRIRKDHAAEWGLDDETMLVVGTNDQYAGALGAGNCRPGIISETTGTCLALVTLTEHLPVPVPPGLFGGRFPIPKYQFTLAYMKTAGILIEWFKDRFCPNLTIEDLGRMAAAVPPGCNGVTMLPFFDGMVSPVPNSDARGMIYGLTLSSGIGEIYRAILESISFSLRENLESLRGLGLKTEVIRSIGGGAKSDLWLQMKADVTGIPIERPTVTEAATLGAAMLAAVGMGCFDSLEECSQAFYHAQRVFEPAAGSAYEDPYSAYIRLSERLF